MPKIKKDGIQIKRKYQNKIHIRKYKDYNNHYENLIHIEFEYGGKEMEVVVQQTEL